MRTTLKSFEYASSEPFSTETEIRMMAWLYMLFVYYKEGMGVKEWGRDNRMGVTFDESIKWLVDKGFAKFSEGRWFITKKGKDELYVFFKPPETRDEWLNYDSSWLEKYDTKSGYEGYTISSIPTDLFEIKYHQDTKENIQYTLTGQEYYKLGEWWIKFQRGTVQWWTYLNRFLNKKNELIPDVSKMTLYRGLHFWNTEYTKSYCVTDQGQIRVKDLKVGDRLLCNKPSWTLDMNIAKMFASGKQGYGDMRKMGEGELGVVLKNVFPSTELLLDTDFVKNNKYLLGDIVLGGEMEVIVRPRNRYVEVVEIFDFKSY